MKPSATFFNNLKVICILIASFSISAVYAEKNCPSLSTNAQEMIKVANLSIDSTYSEKQNACLLNRHLNLLSEGFSLLKNTQFNAGPPSDDDLYSSDLGKTPQPYLYFRSRTKKLELQFKCEYKHALALAYFDSKKIVFCGNQIEETIINKSPYSMDVLASAFVHEARHLDESDKGHTLCTHGEKSGQKKGCDQSKEQKGAYHYGTEYLLALSVLSKNIHPILKATSNASLLHSFANDFVQIPKIKSNLVSLVREIDGQLKIFDKEKLSPSIGNFKGLKPFDLGNGKLFFVNPLDHSSKVIDSFYGDSSHYLAQAFVDSKELTQHFSEFQFPHSFSKSAIAMQGALGALSINYDISDSGAQISESLSLQIGPIERFLNTYQCQGSSLDIFIQSADQRTYRIYRNKSQFKIEETTQCNLDFQTLYPEMALGLNGQLLSIEAKDTNKADSLGSKKEANFKNERSYLRPHFINQKFDFISVPFSLHSYFLRSLM